VTVRYVALLRGVNVGRGNRISMTDLKSLVAGLGFTGVRTLLNSGNVVFDGPAQPPDAIAARMTAALADELGVRSRVVVLTAEEIAEALAADPLTAVADDPSRSLVAFLADPADAARVRPLLEQDWAPEAIAAGRRAVYLWCPDGVSDSAVGKALGRVLGDAVTSRNRATVERIDALMRQA
jgi:uncharacterized protein (DUF1697 family)